MTAEFSKIIRARKLGSSI